MNIQVTQEAYDNLVKLGLDHATFLRLGVKSGGCSGMTYDARLDREIRTGDSIIYHEPPVRIVAHREQAALLDGLSIDYSNDLVKSGFRLSNPNNAHSCGCGASFKSSQGCGTGCG